MYIFIEIVLVTKTHDVFFVRRMLLNYTGTVQIEY